VAEQQVIAPLTTAEFRNLAGRAGRPGAARGIEGMTLVALPKQISSTAAGSRATQQRQRAELAGDYERLRASLLIEEQDADNVDSPLALLLNRISDRARVLLGITPEAFLDWLAVTAPGGVSPEAGTGATDGAARLADAMDELDAILLAALEEVAGINGAAAPRAGIEAQLAALWRTTFTAVATAQQAWLEHAFIRRGVGIVETRRGDCLRGLPRHDGTRDHRQGRSVR
jgi:hypothetical protein